MNENIRMVTADSPGSSGRPYLHDPLAVARLVLVVAVVWTLVAAGATAVLIFRQTPESVTRAGHLVAQFELSSLALVPAGLPRRLSPGVGSSVDPRFSPRLPAADPTPTTLLLPRLHTQ